MTPSYKPAAYIQWIVLALFLFFFWPAYFYQAPSTGIDPSWSIALHLARQSHLVFGREFIFTYGPLGILYCRLPIGVNLLFYLLSDLFYLGSFLWIVKRLLKENAGAGTLIYLFLCVLAGAYISINLWYFIFFLYFLFSFLREKENTALLIQAALLSVISFYIKVSSGMTAIGIFLACLVFCVVFARMTIRYFLVVLLAYLLFIFLSALVLHVALVDYIRVNLQLIGFYNDSMMRPIGADYRAFLYPAVFTVLIAVVWFAVRLGRAFLKKKIREDAGLLFIYGTVALSAFVFFKGAFVRSDTHIYHFYEYIGPLAGLLFLFTPRGERRLAAIACWVILLPALWAINALPGSRRPYTRLVTLGIFTDKAGEIGTYFKGIGRYNSELRHSDSLRYSDNPYRKIIGDSTVDIMPHEVSTLYFNGLRYDPRPVIQSYSAYSEYLDKLNYAKYTSPDAPQYVLFNIGSVDDRVPFFDETRTKLALLDRYEVAGR
ncbi:MAG TPA: hypothetical protein VKQ52_11720, partial [Puia sp.]|nr:hypothetical protein [Puia sp.]